MEPVTTNTDAPKKPVMDIQPPKPSGSSEFTNTSSATMPTLAPEPAPAQEPNSDMHAPESQSPAHDDDLRHTDAAAPDQVSTAPKKKKPVLMVVIVLLIVGTLAGTAVYMYLKGSESKPTANTASTSTPTQNAATQSSSKVTPEDVDSVSQSLDKEIDAATNADATGGSNLSDQSLGL